MFAMISGQVSKVRMGLSWVVPPPPLIRSDRCPFVKEKLAQLRGTQGIHGERVEAMISPSQRRPSPREA